MTQVSRLNVSILVTCAAEVRRQLISQKQYKEASLPSERTIGRRLNQLGYYPARIAKTKPLKTIPETNAIMKQVSEINQEADSEETTLRISLDAKARVKLGEARSRRQDLCEDFC